MRRSIERVIARVCIAAVFAALILSATLPAPAAEKHPNVVVILSDDQGWGDLSINGNQNLSTPRIDSIGQDGAQLQRFFVCPVCSPTRAEFLTGRYHPRCGVWSTSTGGERLDLDERTIAQVFQQAGYTTAAFGKWHNGSQWPYHPRARGFGEYYGFTSGHWGHYFDPILEHCPPGNNGPPGSQKSQIVHGKGFIADDFTDHALEFIAANQSRPFFCYLAFNTPHSPMQVPDRFYDKFADAPLAMRYEREGKNDADKEDLGHTRAALAMVENLDWNVGRVLDELDNLKLSERTIVVYFCDNGPNGWRWNGGMRGRKASTDEGGVRSPCLVRYPGRIRPGTNVRTIAAAIDLLPTLTGLADVPITNEKPLDGVSLAPLLESKQNEASPRMIFSHWAGKVSVRTQQFRLDDQGRLYDMEADPGQYADVREEHADVAQQLSAAVDAWKQELLPGLTDDQRPFPVGYREFPTTYLPVRDAKFSGGIQRSSRAPNCSFLTNWTNDNDRITWDVEIATTGRYQATLYYTCPQSDVGATIQLSLGPRHIEAKLNQPHDPPLVGAQEDRVPRQGESYVKDFAPWSLGVIELKQGRGQLTLRATSIPGKQACDVRAVALELLP